MGKTMNHLHEMQFFFTGFKPVRIAIGRFEFPESLVALVCDEAGDNLGKTVLHARLVDGSGEVRTKSFVLESNAAETATEPNAE